MWSAPTLQQLLLGGSVALLVAGNCAKPSAPGPDFNTQQLTSHLWHVVGYKTIDYTAAPNKVTDLYAGLPAYRRDDTYQFLEDYVLDYNEGQLKAQASDPQATTGSWQFQNSQADLDLVLGQGAASGTLLRTATYRLSTLTYDTLRLSMGVPAQTTVVTLAK